MHDSVIGDGAGRRYRRSLILTAVSWVPPGFWICNRPRRVVRVVVRTMRLPRGVSLIRTFAICPGSIWGMSEANLTRFGAARSPASREAPALTKRLTALLHGFAESCVGSHRRRTRHTDRVQRNRGF